MKVRITKSFYSQVKEYNFNFTCESCVYFNEGSKSCSHYYPNDLHLWKVFEGFKAKGVTFCKEFELF